MNLPKNNKNNRINILIDKFEGKHAGTENQILKLITGLKSSNWIVNLTILRSSEYIENNTMPCDIQVLHIQKLLRIHTLLKLIMHAYRLKCTGTVLVHIFYSDSSLITPPLLKMFGIKCIISRRDMGFWYTNTYLRISRFTRHFVNHVICNSYAVKNLVSQKEKYRDDEISVIYNGYNTDSSGNVSSGKLVKISDKNQVIGIVANLKPIKRIGDLIKAFRLVKDKFSEVELHIIGDGDNSIYQKLAYDLDITDCTKFWGQIDDSESYITDFDVAVLCSESEGFSNSIIEYMIHGKPVVCTNTGGNVEIVEDGINGYLVEVGDISALAERIYDLLNDRNKAEKFGHNGKNLVCRKFSNDLMIKKHINLYNSIDT